MKQFVAIFRVPNATMDEWQKNTKPEDVQAQMQKMGADMQAWVSKHKASFVGQGMPLGKTKTVTKDGAKDSRNDLNYVQVVQAETHEEACAIFADCPHMGIPSSSIDVMEVPHMGM